MQAAANTSTSAGQRHALQFCEEVVPDVHVQGIALDADGRLYWTDARQVSTFSTSCKAWVVAALAGRHAKP